MRKGIMRYNGKRYAQRDGKRTGGILDKARKPLDGYYQRIRGGVFLYSMDMEMFAFISTHGKQFVVDAPAGVVSAAAINMHTLEAEVGFELETDLGPLCVDPVNTEWLQSVL